MNKLLIIGAGIGQIPLLEKAKSRGIHVVVVTRRGDYPCIPLADETIYIDIYNRAAIVQEAQRIGITAVVSDQNDLTNPTVAYVAEKLGLPGNKFETVMTYCNKNFFRDTCDSVGVPCPKHVAVSSLSGFDAKGIPFPLPWIVKPADSQSSIGVRKIERAEEVAESLAFALEKSPTHSAIVEEFFVGRELVCEGFVRDGKYYLLGFADRKYFDLNGLMIPSQTLFPSTIDPQYMDRIVEYEQRLASATNPSFAIIHSEYLVDEESGEIRIVESALRGGGVYISSDLVPLSTGIDINDVLLDLALGKQVDVEKIFLQRKENAAGYVCFCLPKGHIASIDGSEALQRLPFVSKAFLDDIQIGEETAEMTYKGARKGPILVCGKDRDELESNIKVVQQTLDIKVQTEQDDLLGIVWG